ncbi:hypothetical protein FHX44_118135 [Pseudonocardia hierapolitana]|uniref:Uncharacterized protein n=1 Tax=Pseudonocardia hierapolitana TaxID=1128676 RepID=A0A561T506_9PSEU|nr:hypothetical protein FHX44_118135 [Pseudonocardia hierapolitana]
MKLEVVMVPVADVDKAMGGWGGGSMSTSPLAMTIARYI